MDSTRTDMVAERLHCHPTPISSGRLHPHKMSNPGAYPLKVWPHHFFFFLLRAKYFQHPTFLRSVSLVWCDPACASVGQRFFTFQSVYCLPPHRRKKRGGKYIYGSKHDQVDCHFQPLSVLSESKQYGPLLLQMICALSPSCLCVYQISSFFPPNLLYKVGHWKQLNFYSKMRTSYLPGDLCQQATLVV